MKVYIDKPNNWFGPYQLAEKLCFWARDSKDKYGISRKPDWVHSFGEWLAHGSVEPDPVTGSITSCDFERKKTVLYKMLSWIDSRKPVVRYVKIDKWDTWSMDNTLAPIILPMLKQLRDTKHGAPFVEDADVPDALKSTSAPAKENEYDTDGNHFKRWDYVLDEMIFAFEHLADDSWEDKYRTGEIDFAWKQMEGGNSQMVDGPKHTFKCDFEGMKKEQEQISRGLVLFGKYFQSLWD